MFSPSIAIVCKKFTVFCPNCHTRLVIRQQFITFVPRMKKIRIDVVGLSHNDVRHRWEEYISKSLGRRLTLQPQPDNIVDSYAVRAREGLDNIGYVAVTDLDVVYQALKGSGRERLQSKVVEFVVEPPVITVEAEVDQIDCNYDPYDDSAYADWHYDGMSLLPRKLEQMNDLTLDLQDALDSDAPKDEIIELAQTLLNEHLYDASREMTRKRYWLEQQLSQRSEPELQAIARQLREQKGMLMRYESREKVAQHLFIEWPTQLKHNGLDEYHYTYDNRLDELEEQLRAFPHHLYDKFLTDPVDFLREVYYKHVSRRYLFPLLSGIVLMILKGRVSIERWGREGDTEPIKKIKHLAPKLTPSEREQAMKDAIKALLLKKNADGKPIINQKNQWAGFASVLMCDYSLLDEAGCDMRAFCKKMNDWGFGADSNYEIFCDYDNISKDSNYAQTPFHKWSGNGAKHQRMQKAATELRDILRDKIGYK